MSRKCKCLTFGEVKINQFFLYEKRTWKKVGIFKAEMEDGVGFAIFNPGCEIELLNKKKKW